MSFKSARSFLSSKPTSPNSFDSTSFDLKSFCKTANERGRAYRYQAIELIKLCQLFSASQKPIPVQYVRLQSVIEACDIAIYNASRSPKIRESTDHEISLAVRKLHEYERDFHANINSVVARMEEAKRRDKKGKREDIISAKDPTLRVVRFHLLRSLSDTNPVIVEQALISTSNLPDILWSFSHFEDGRRLTLAQNPHFYGKTTLPTTYEPAFNVQPTEDYQDTICVLTNSERRVFLDLGQKQRIFDNIWRINNTLIFRDILGKLEGEATVGNSIPALPLFWSRKDPEFQLEAIGNVEDWRAPILDLWNSPRTHIYIRTH